MSHPGAGHPAPTGYRDRFRQLLSSQGRFHDEYRAVAIPGTPAAPLSSPGVYAWGDTDAAAAAAVTPATYRHFHPPANSPAPTPAPVPAPVPVPASLRSTWAEPTSSLTPASALLAPPPAASVAVPAQLSPGVYRVLPSSSHPDLHTHAQVHHHEALLGAADWLTPTPAAEAATAAAAVAGDPRAGLPTVRAAGPRARARTGPAADADPDANGISALRGTAPVPSPAPMPAPAPAPAPVRTPAPASALRDSSSHSRGGSAAPPAQRRVAFADDGSDQGADRGAAGYGSASGHRGSGTVSGSRSRSGGSGGSGSGVQASVAATVDDYNGDDTFDAGSANDHNHDHGDGYGDGYGNVHGYDVRYGAGSVYGAVSDANADAGGAYPGAYGEDAAASVAAGAGAPYGDAVDWGDGADGDADAESDYAGPERPQEELGQEAEQQQQASWHAEWLRQQQQQQQQQQQRQRRQRELARAEAAAAALELRDPSARLLVWGEAAAARRAAATAAARTAELAALARECPFAPAVQSPARAGSCSRSRSRSRAVGDDLHADAADRARRRAEAATAADARAVAAEGATFAPQLSEASRAMIQALKEQKVAQWRAERLACAAADARTRLQQQQQQQQQRAQSQWPFRPQLGERSRLLAERSEQRETERVRGAASPAAGSSTRGRERARATQDGEDRNGSVSRSASRGRSGSASVGFRRQRRASMGESAGGDPMPVVAFASGLDPSALASAVQAEAGWPAGNLFGDRLSTERASPARVAPAAGRPADSAASARAASQARRRDVVARLLGRAADRTHRLVQLRAAAEARTREQCTFRPAVSAQPPTALRGSASSGALTSPHAATSHRARSRSGSRPREAASLAAASPAELPVPVLSSLPFLERQELFAARRAHALVAATVAATPAFTPAPAPGSAAVLAGSRYRTALSHETAEERALRLSTLDAVARAQTLRRAQAAAAAALPFRPELGAVSQLLAERRRSDLAAAATAAAQAAGAADADADAETAPFALPRESDLLRRAAAAAAPALAGALTTDAVKRSASAAAVRARSAAGVRRPLAAVAAEVEQQRFGECTFSPAVNNVSRLLARDTITVAKMTNPAVGADAEGTEYAEYLQARDRARAAAASRARELAERAETAECTFVPARSAADPPAASAANPAPIAGLDRFMQVRRLKQQQDAELARRKDRVFGYGTSDNHPAARLRRAAAASGGTEVTPFALSKGNHAFGREEAARAQRAREREENSFRPETVSRTQRELLARVLRDEERQAEPPAW